MANQTATGSVAMNDVIEYVKKHPIADGQKGYPKGSAEANKFLEFYREKCGNVIRTNRGHEYRNTKDNDRLDQHARWHLRKAVEAMNRPAKPAKTATTGETDGTPAKAEGHETKAPVKQTQAHRKQAHRRAS